MVFHSQVARAVTGKSLSTCVVPVQEVGEKALDMLIQKIAVGKSYKSISLPFKFVDDGSVCSPKE